MANDMFRGVAVAFAVVPLLILPTGLVAQVIERISLDSDGHQGDGASWVPTSTRVVSADGRFVVFSSDAANLVENNNAMEHQGISRITSSFG